MGINIANKPILQGSFNLQTKKSEKDEQKNVIKNKNENDYEEKIKGIEEKIKNVQASELDDADTKKEKIKALQDEIKELRRLQHEEEIQKLKSEKEKNENAEKPYQENADGDKLTLSDQMKEMIKGERTVKKQEEKAKIKKELEVKASMVEIGIENARGLNKSASNKLLAEMSIGQEVSRENLPESISREDLEEMDYKMYDTMHNGKELEELKEAIENLDDNEWEKLAKEDDGKNSIDEMNKKPSEKDENKLSEDENDNVNKNKNDNESLNVNTDTNTVSNIEENDNITV